MKSKVSISIRPDLLRRLDDVVAFKGGNRSRVVQRLVVLYLAKTEGRVGVKQQ